MYNNQLTQRAVSVDEIFLDPNNPRFWSEQTRNMGAVADPKVPDAANQARAMEQIKFRLFQKICG